ncbi:hypothetical protein [Novosphingobium sp.]|uniref:hypothetical protein n=1 Tax=Novosphingobium sp. TaxID=1874826 RepID=UPI003D098523
MIATAANAPLAAIQALVRFRTMTRNEAVCSLVDFDRPLNVVIAALRSYGWDWDGEPIAKLSTANVTSVIQRYFNGEMGGREVETWANALEGRDDVEFDPGAAHAIFQLANPVLHGPLREVAASLIARL